MKFLLIILTVFAISACSSQPERIIVRTPNQQLEIIAPSDPRPMRIEDVQVNVYDKERLFEELSNNRFEPIIGMTPANYEIMLNNISETGRYISSLHAIIQYYQNIIRELQE